MGRNLRDELNALDVGHPESWRPEPGEVLVGTVVRFDKASTPYGDRDIVVVHDEDRGVDVGVWLIHTVLIEAFRQQQPGVGDRLAIKRFDDHEKGYKRYRLVVDRPGESVPS
jgi:hypothetical protein|tara:strand:+ start:189 stop:524 length:336 start_codon:yes stop_codon:yes gene_type:complete